MTKPYTRSSAQKGNQDATTQTPEAKVLPGEKFFTNNRATRIGGDEVMNYLSEARVGSSETIGEYYNGRKTSFPVIYLMAKAFLAAPAMSTSIENLFSVADAMGSQGLNRLLSASIKRLMLLKSRGVITDDVVTVCDNKKEFAEEMENNVKQNMIKRE